ncbi:MAG: hypothetical protein SVR08_16270 [Spirochaetota bacterium]|nr:hypothetical protein [Spirochaetota bacterium]
MIDIAQRRMFSLKIIDTDNFIDMPATARLLYYDLSMRADDDGFVNSPHKIIKMTNASLDDYRILLAKQYIIKFESGICVIKDWKIHNYIAKDRYNETLYVNEKKQLEIDTNGSYTKCIQNVHECETQVRLGKDRLGKDRIDKIEEETHENEHSDTDNLSSEIINQSVSENSNDDKEKNTDRQLMIDLFYKDYEKLYGEKLEFTPKELGCIKNLLKKNKNSFNKKYDLLLKECKKEKNTFFKLTPSVLLYSWNQLVEIKKESWEERMERIKKGDLHYE